MSEIEVTITADEDDLRDAIKAHEQICCSGWAACPIAAAMSAIAAALPKPLVKVKPGMVLRSKDDGVRWFITGSDLIMVAYNADCTRTWQVPLVGVDGDRYEVLLDVEDDA